MKRLALTTMGCRVNFHDSDQLDADARAAGYRRVPFKGAAEVYVINTCTVTAAADAEARKLARAARRRNPAARVVVTGCYAEVSPGALRAMPEVDLVVGTLEKPRLFEHLAALTEGRPAPPPRPASRPVLEPPRVAGRGLRQRPVLKVQDGCNHRCTFCVIPRARGASRSLGLDECRRQLEAFAAAGAPEVVVSGVHLASYGRDLRPRLTLEDLLSALAVPPRLPRLRLSSVEPVDLTPGVIDLMAARPDRFCRFLHMAVQSGSSAVLTRMRRRYGRADFEARTRHLLARLPGLGLGLDLLVGFPGETEADFAATCDLVERLPVLRAHVFPYSERPDTAALALDGSVPVPVRKARARRLRQLAAKRREAVLSQMVGAVRPATTIRQLEATSEAPALVECVTDTGVEVFVEGRAEPGLGAVVRLGGPRRDGLAGRWIEGPAPADRAGESIAV